MALGAVTIAGPDVEASDPEVAARQQRTHLELAGQRNRGLVAVLGLAHVTGAARVDVAQHVQRGGGIPALSSLLRKGERPLGAGRCLVDANGEELRLTE